MPSPLGGRRYRRQDESPWWAVAKDAVSFHGDTRTGLRRAVFEYIEGWYNTRRLSQPRSARNYPPQRRPSGGIINPGNLSVKADQVQGALRLARRRQHRGHPARRKGDRGRALHRPEARRRRRTKKAGKVPHEAADNNTVEATLPDFPASTHSQPTSRCPSRQNQIRPPANAHSKGPASPDNGRYIATQLHP